MTPWTSIRAGREHLVQIGALAETHYGTADDTSHADYLAHEYFANPDGDALVQIAWNEQTQEADGQFVVIPRRLHVGDRSVLLLKSVNTIIRESRRGQGVFSALAHDVLDKVVADGNYALSEGMPNPHSHSGFVKKLGYHDLGLLPLYVRLQRPSHLVRDFLHAKALSVLAKPLDFCCRYTKDATPPDGITFVRLCTDNLLVADQFWQQIQHKYPVMFSRDSAFLRYRLLENPRRSYECWYAVENGKPVAYAMGRVMPVSGMSCAMVGDFLFLDGYETAARALLRHLLFILEQQGGDLAGCLMQPFTEEAKILRHLGFFVCPKFLEPQPFCVILRVLKPSKELSAVNDFKNWFYTMGDNDII